MSFTVRPSNSEKEAFRVKLTAVSLLSLKLSPGDLVLLQVPNDDGSKPRPAIAWENSGSGMKDTIVQTSKTLQELHGFKLGDRIGILRSREVLEDASVVIVKTGMALSNQEQSDWQALLSAVMPTKYDVLAPGQKFTAEVGCRKGEFEVVDVGGLLGRVTNSTQFVLDGSSRVSGESTTIGLQLDFAGVGGLTKEIEKVKRQVKLVLRSGPKEPFPFFRARQGLLLYGSKGTGKTLLQDTLARDSWGSVIRWTSGVKLPTPVFPRLIVVDLQDLTGIQRAVSELLALFQAIKGTPTLVVGEARHPNDVSERLRTTEAFACELELPIPDRDKRLSILWALRRGGNQPSDEQLTEIADRTHGFVGADLDELLNDIGESVLLRAIEAGERKASHAVNGIEAVNGDSQSYSKEDTTTFDLPSDILITQHDIDSALSSAQPSALQEVFLEKPNIHWADIGGQHALKHKLTTTVSRTLSPTLRKRMIDFGLSVPKGILLYGPPGCSKTLLAKALATEAELNFLAVKGAELISMYVGESERATREVFRKARAAAPSILFFDEIDAIATRPDPNSSRGGGGDLNVLTTLLNEMDGFEELKDVLIVAATNKPQSIDVALLRPGRFDNVVYVGLPDVDTRTEIFEKRLCRAGVLAADEVRDRTREWAERTEGFSGAEVVGICKAAGEFAFDADHDRIEVTDVERAILGAARGISRDMLEEYEAWNAARSVNGS